MAISPKDGSVPFWLIDLGEIGQIDVLRDGKRVWLWFNLNADADGLRVTQLTEMDRACDCEECLGRRGKLN